MEWDRTQYATDLEKLPELINKYNADDMLQNLSTILSRASVNVQNNQKSIIKVDVQGLEIILNKRMSGSVPSDLQSVTIYLDSFSEFDTEINIETRDIILDTYKFHITVTGINATGEHYNAWHLDKDIRVAEANPPKVSHPLYHFQAGGNYLDNKNISGVVFLGAPRLPHPPMDVILGLHFILKNFCNTKDYPFVQKIFNDIEYQYLVQRAKDRMFKPYFKAFEQGNIHDDFTVENVFPMAHNE